MRVADGRAMSNDGNFKDAEEREISRGGKPTAMLMLGLAVVVIAGGVALAMGLQRHVAPPQRPGTTSASTPAGETKPPSPPDAAPATR